MATNAIVPRDIHSLAIAELAAGKAVDGVFSQKAAATAPVESRPSLGRIVKAPPAMAMVSTLDTSSRSAHAGLRYCAGASITYIRNAGRQANANWKRAAMATPARRLLAT